MIPCPAVILHTMGSGDQPAWTDDGRSAHVTEILDMEADLPGKLPFIRVLTAHNTWRLELIPSTVCKVSNQSMNQSWGWRVAACFVCGRQFTSVLSCTVTMQTEIITGFRVTYRSSPRRIRPRSPVFRHTLGSLYWCIYCFYIYMWDQCSLQQWLQREGGKSNSIQTIPPM